MAEAESKDGASRSKLNLSPSTADSLRRSEGHLHRSPSLETARSAIFPRSLALQNNFKKKI